MIPFEASGAFRPEAPEPRQRMAPEGESADAEEDDTADAVNWSLPGIIPSLHARNASVSPLCNFMMKSAWFPSYRDCLAHSSVTGVTADWGDDDLFPRLNWLHRPNPEARTAAPDLLPRVDPYLQSALAAQASQEDDPAAACLARILSAEPQPLRYLRPSFVGDMRMFRDLVAYAPGMNTTRADILDVLDDLGFYLQTIHISRDVVHHYFYWWIRGYVVLAQPYIAKKRVENGGEPGD